MHGKRFNGRPNTTCHHKRRFKDLERAKQALSSIRESPRARAPHRYYYCERCNGWHLSSRDE